MSIKLEIVSNHLVVTGSEIEEFDFPRKSIFYKINKEILYLFVNKDNPRSFGDHRGYPLQLTGTVTLDTGASGSVDGITVDGIEIMSASVPFNSSLSQTATDVAANITANTSTPNYSALAVGATITIKNETSSNEVNEDTVTTTATTITHTDVDMGIKTGGLINNLGNNFSGIEGVKIFFRENTGGLITSGLAPNALSNDAWDRPKSIQDRSLLHGMFTFNVPVTMWKESINNVVQSAFSNATSVDGKLVLTSGGVSEDVVCLDTFRNPRYEPNRGHLYSSSVILPNKSFLGNRKFGFFTGESGAFFSLESGVLYAVVRTTLNAVTSEDKYILNTTNFNLEKGNIYDIQMQWRGVGNYKFFINLQEVKEISYLGTRTELSMFNPANPISFECENLGNEVEIHCGCVDVSSEGGSVNGKQYGSVQIENESGQVAVAGYNQPVIAVRSKLTVGSQRNTRDTLALLASAYSDQKSMMRVWATRDFTAITDGTQTWSDFGDGHLEYMILDPATGTPMAFDTAKATPAIFGSRVGQDTTYSTSALFEDRTSIYQTPGDMFIFTVHRENGGAANVGVTYEFAEEI